MKIKFEMKEAEKTVRSLIISEIVDLESKNEYQQKRLDNDKADDENLTTALVAINKIKLEALRQALIENDFQL